MNERMDARTRAVFRCLYIARRPWSRVKDENKNHLKPQQINVARESAIRAIAEEVMSIAYINEKETEQNGPREENEISAE